MNLGMLREKNPFSLPRTSTRPRIIEESIHGKDVTIKDLFDFAQTKEKPYDDEKLAASAEGETESQGIGQREKNLASSTLKSAREVNEDSWDEEANPKKACNAHK